VSSQLWASCRPPPRLADVEPRLAMAFAVAPALEDQQAFPILQEPHPARPPLLGSDFDPRDFAFYVAGVLAAGRSTAGCAAERTPAPPDPSSVARNPSRDTSGVPPP
jgi:hypothetical protein